MRETNAEDAVRDPDSLIGGVDAGSHAAALSRAAFMAILDGRTPRLSELAKATEAEVEQLVGRAVIVDDGGYVVAARGLSLVPARQHRLAIRGRHFWTWCAIDVIGIPAGLREDAVAETSCSLCGTPVRVEFREGMIAHASHPGATIWDAQRRDGRGTAGPPHCALMNLFCSVAHLGGWRAANLGEAGRARTLSEAVEIGRAEWGALVDGRSGCSDECCP